MASGVARASTTIDFRVGSEVIHRAAWANYRKIYRYNQYIGLCTKVPVDLAESRTKVPVAPCTKVPVDK